MNSAFVRRFYSLIALPFSLAACQGPTGPQPAPRGLEIQPTAAVFPVQTVNGQRTARIEAVVTNDSDETVYYSYCTEGIAKRVGAAWISVWRPACASILVPPEAISPGDSKTLAVQATEQPGVPIEFPFNDPSAEYRMEVILLIMKGDKLFTIKGTEIGTFAVRN